MIYPSRINRYGCEINANMAEFDIENDDIDLLKKKIRVWFNVG